MKKDVSSITEWAEIFTQPVALNRETTKNWQLHEKEIRANAAKAQTDWEAGKYFDAGKDTAAAVNLLVPFPKARGADEAIGEVFIGCYTDPNHPAGYRFISFTDTIVDGKRKGTCDGSDTSKT